MEMTHIKREASMKTKIGHCCSSSIVFLNNLEANSNVQRRKPCTYRTTTEIFKYRKLYVVNSKQSLASAFHARIH